MEQIFLYTSLFLSNFIDLSAEASPWLLLGLLIAGLMKAWVPTQILSKHLGQGKSAIFKAAFIGAPLPLCSCGVIPVATELRRSGASAPATTAFLVATPETGVDSVTVSYAMLGPIMAIYRPITAITSAILTGFLVAGTKEETPQIKEKVTKGCCAVKTPVLQVSENKCCAKNNSPDEIEIEQPSLFTTFRSKTITGIHYAATRLIDDLIIWLLIGLIFASLVRTFIPTSFLLIYGNGLAGMFLMVAISIPMYICATASTPIAAGFIMAGLSPGTALVFMMAGPATNISTLGVIKSEMGLRVLIRYLVGIAGCSIGFGSLLDFLLNFYAIDISQQMQHSHSLLPYWFGILTFLVITILAIKPIRRIFID